MKKIILSIFVFFTLFTYNLKADGEIVEVFKSASCGCCSSWAKYMEENGYKVKVNILQDKEVVTVKQKYGVPQNMYACHIAIINGLVVEGHVPVEAIKKALADKTVNKIAVPNMPAGSPGMGGKNTNGYVVYSIEKDGSVKNFYTVKN